MKLIASWLMVVAVLCGLHTRVLTNDSCRSLTFKEPAGHCDSEHSQGQPCKSDHNDDCPAGHHHCGATCHVLPPVSALDFACTLAAPASSRARILAESDAIPEGPYLTADRPPII